MKMHVKPPVSWIPPTLLKILALIWLGGAVACLGQVYDGDVPSFPQVTESLIWLTIASLSAIVGIGLWRRRPWARIGALLLCWVPLALSALVFLWAIIVESDIALGFVLLFSIIGIPVIVIVTLQTYFLLHPATKALFGVTDPVTDSRKPSRRKKGRALGIFKVASISIVTLIAAWIVVTLILRSLDSRDSREPRDIRYQASGEWSEREESKFIKEPPPGRYVSVSVGAGFANDGSWFRVVGSKLLLGASPIDPSDTVLPLPEGLLNSRSWSVIASADGRRIICVNERGLAVWRAVPPHNLMHSWAITSEPMAGEKRGTALRYGSIPYERNELILAYEVSPDGRLACVHAAEQRRFYSGQSSVGVVILRDLESGEEIARLEHPGSGLEIERVAWSGDSQHLATFSRKSGQVTVWDVTKREVIGRISEFAEQLALSADGSLLYTVFTGKTSTGTSGADRPRTIVHRVADGTHVARRRMDCLQLVLSPDGKYLAAITRNSVELMDSQTLESLWSSPGPRGRGLQIKFSSDGTQLAAVTNNTSGLMAAAHVKAWKVADGTVVLDAPTNAASGSTSGVGFGNDDSIWTYGASNWSRFKLIGKP